MPMRKPRMLRRRKPLARKPLARKTAPKKAYRRRGPLRYYTQAGQFTNSLWRYGQRNRVSKQVLAMKRVGAPDELVINGGSLIQPPNPGYQTYVSFPILPQERLTELNQIAGNQSAPNRVLVESVLSELTFTNLSNAAAEVEMYDIICKRDVLESASISIGETAYITPGSVEDYIRVGVNAAAGRPADSNYSAIVGTSPYDSQFFQTYFKVVRKQHVMLGSGASHRHQSMLKINKVINQSLAGSSDLALIKGYTHIVLLQVRGVAGYDTVTELGTPPKVSLNSVFTQRIKYTFVQDVNSSLTVTDTLSHANPVSIRNTGNGAIEAVSP